MLRPLRPVGVNLGTGLVFAFAVLADANQLDARHFCIVAKAFFAQAHDAGIAARTLLERGADGGEKVFNGVIVTQAGKGKAAVGDRVHFRKRDQRLCEAAQFFGFDNTRGNGVVGEQGHRQMFHCCFTVGHVPTQAFA